MRRIVVFATAEAAEEAFYDAMQRGDLAAMMALWAEDEDVVCIHPGGSRLVGLPAVRMSFGEIFTGGGVDVRPTEVRVHQGAVIAVHSVLEKIVVRSEVGARIATCVATNVYVKQANGWRIVMHHSASSGESEPPAVEAIAAVLH
jgi:uncharacterized protein (TIGR02246 family)